MKRVAVVVFPGSNCDAETLAAARAAGPDAFFVWHRDTDLRQADVVILPGGFSYGDYLRSGAIARFSPAMGAVAEHARAGGAVLGICNGFQILCEAGLLPGGLMRNARLKFLSRPAWVRVETTGTPFTCLYDQGDVLEIPIAHGDGRYVVDERTAAELEASDRVVWRYGRSATPQPVQQPTPLPPEPAPPATPSAEVPARPPRQVPERPAASRDVPYSSVDTGTIAPGMGEKDVYSLWGPPIAVRHQGEWTYLF